MSEAARDTRLSIQARGIAFWIFENPSEAINPDAIASANNMTVGYVRKLLAELAEYGYLVAPQKYKAAKGRFAYTPYTLPPQALTTVTVEEPARSDNQHGQTTSTVESIAVSKHDQPEISTSEYVRAPGDAATRVKDLSLEQKQKDRQTDNKPPANLDQAAGERESVRLSISADAEKVRDAFMGNLGVMVGDELTELTGHVTLYGLEPVMVMIARAAQKQRKDGLRDRMAYIRQGLSNMALEGNVPKFNPAKKLSVPASNPITAESIAANKRHIEQEHRRLQHEMLGA